MEGKGRGSRLDQHDGRTLDRPLPGPVNRDALEDLYHVIQQPQRRPDAIRIAFTRLLEQERIALDHRAHAEIDREVSPNEDEWCPLCKETVTLR